MKKVKNKTPPVANPIPVAVRSLWQPLPSQICVDDAGETILIQSVSGVPLGRFSRQGGMTIHNTAMAQARGVKEDLHRTAEPGGLEQWEQFCGLLAQHHCILLNKNLLSFEGPMEKSKKELSLA